MLSRSFLGSYDMHNVHTHATRIEMMVEDAESETDLELQKLAM